MDLNRKCTIESFLKPNVFESVLTFKGVEAKAENTKKSMLKSKIVSRSRDSKVTLRSDRFCVK